MYLLCVSQEHALLEVRGQFPGTHSSSHHMVSHNQTQVTGLGGEPVMPPLPGIFLAWSYIQAQWLMPITWALSRLRQEDQFETTLSLMSPYLKSKQKSE